MKRILIIICFSITLNGLQAQKSFNEMTLSEQKLYNEHIILGQPDTTNAPVFVRQGYISKYNEKLKIPDWVAYRVIPDYLKTPKREKKYKYFRTDPDIDNAVRKKDYTGSGYARGHMAPYFAMGGDRDRDGVYSDLFNENADPQDDLTVFQANYMSNMAPQKQKTLNGAGGPWYALETVIRNKLVGNKGMELNVVVGGIVKDSDNYKMLDGKYEDVGIAIPEMFFQVLIYKNENGEYITGGFLFPHVCKKTDLPFEDVIDYIVPVDSIEKLSGFNFLNKYNKQKQNSIESMDNKQFWMNNGFK